MKKVIIALALSISVSGCAAIFQRIGNPVTPAALYEGELVFDAALKTFNELRGLCVSRVLPPACRTYVKKGQGLIVNAAAADKAARNFVTANPTLDATNVVQAFTSIVTDFKTTLADLSATK